MTTRFDEKQAQFRAFHKAHPEVWSLFCRFAFDAINAGRKHIGANAVIERIRWETNVVADRGDEFKINNDHAPFYARMFMANYPEWDGLFRTRRQTSRDAPATNLPPLGPSDWPYQPKGEMS